jgi:hypothetical protein
VEKWTLLSYNLCILQKEKKMDYELNKRFDYHKPDERKTEYHENVRSACKALAERLTSILPDGREKSLAITKLEEVMFWANAALARNDLLKLEE